MRSRSAVVLAGELLSGLAGAGHDDDSIGFWKERHHVARHDQRRAVQDDDVGDLLQALQEPSHLRRAEQFSRMLRCHAARDHGDPNDGTGFEVRREIGCLCRIGIIVAGALQQVGEARPLVHAEELVDGRPAQVAGHDQDPATRLSVGHRQVGGDGGLAVARLGTGHEEGSRLGTVTVPSRGPDADQSERVRCTGRRVGGRDDRSPSSPRDRRHLGQHRHTEGVLRRAWGTDPGVEALQHERKDHAGDESEQGGQPDPPGEPFWDLDAVRSRGRLGGRVANRRRRLEDLERYRCRSVDRELIERRSELSDQVRVEPLLAGGSGSAARPLAAGR